MNERHLKKILPVTAGVVLMVSLLAGLLCSPSEGKSRKGGGIGGILSGDQVESILRGAREAGVAIEDIELDKPDLEQVFVRVMNRT